MTEDSRNSPTSRPEQRSYLIGHSDRGALARLVGTLEAHPDVTFRRVIGTPDEPDAVEVEMTPETAEAVKRLEAGVTVESNSDLRY